MGGFLLTALALLGCSEWNIRNIEPPGDTAAPVDPEPPPEVPDTAPPGDEDDDPGEPSPCEPLENPPVLPVWGPGEGPIYTGTWDGAALDFDADGRLLWVLQGELWGAARDGTHQRVESQREYPYRSFVRTLPNGEVVAGGYGQIVVRDPTHGQTVRVLDTEMGIRSAPNDTIAVDTEGALYAALDSGHVARVPDNGALEPLVLLDWGIEEASLAFVDMALTPDEASMYLLAHLHEEQSAQYWDNRLYRIDRYEGGWLSPELVWEAPRGHTHMADLVVDECGHAIVLQAHYAQGRYATTLWYVPLRGEARQLLHADDYRVAHLQWGNGVGGWDADTLYFWAWRSGEEDARLYQIEPGVPGNHVLIR